MKKKGPRKHIPIIQPKIRGQFRGSLIGGARGPLPYPLRGGSFGPKFDAIRQSQRLFGGPPARIIKIRLLCYSAGGLIVKKKGGLFPLLTDGLSALPNLD
jgi:hypothetical protein